MLPHPSISFFLVQQTTASEKNGDLVRKAVAGMKTRRCSDQKGFCRFVEMHAALLSYSYIEINYVKNGKTTYLLVSLADAWQDSNVASLENRNNGYTKTQKKPKN